MFVIACLGNPGARYADTRHNAGFMVADELVRRHAMGLPRARFKAECFEGGIPSGGSVVVLKPQTFMNVSGEAVVPAVGFYKVDASRLIVVHDELDLAFGDVRVKAGGGLAGHNGLKSIAQLLGTRDFLRVRVGVGRPPGKMEVMSYVLAAFNAREREELPFVLGRAADMVETIVIDGIQTAMNRFHGQTATVA